MRSHRYHESRPIELIPKKTFTIQVDATLNVLLGGKFA